MLDAYTVRKAIPRIVIAVIGINLSIYLCVAMVEITTVIGRGIGDLINQGFNPNGITVNNIPLDSGGYAVLSAGALPLLVALGVGALFFLVSFGLIGIVLLIAFAVLFTLIIRQALLVFLTVVSPIAIALFVLPGTEKYFKKWLDLFVKTLLVYPIIMIIFAMSNVMAGILLNDSQGRLGINPLSNTASITMPGIFAQASNQPPGELEQTVKILVAIVVIYAPLVLIPFAFKIAGGAMAAVMNATSNATKNKRAQYAKSAAERSADKRQRFREGRLAEGKRYIPGSQSAARAINRVGLARGAGLRGRYGMGKRGQYAIQNVNESALAGIMKSEEFAKIQQNDDALMAGTYASESEALKGLRERYINKTEADNRNKYIQENIATGMSQMDAVKAAYAKVAQEKDQIEQASTQRAENAVTAFKSSGLRYGNQATQQAMARQLTVTGTGYEGIDDAAQTIARVSDGNEAAQGATTGFVNYATKQSGRNDISPGFGKLLKLAQQEADNPGSVDPAKYREALADDSAGGFDPVTILRSKPKAVEHITQALALSFNKEMATASDSSKSADEQKAAKRKAMQLAAKMTQLNDAKSYAGQQNQMLVNKMREITKAQREALKADVDTSSNPNKAPITDDQKMWAELVPPPKDPRDPNIP